MPTPKAAPAVVPVLSGLFVRVVVSLLSAAGSSVVQPTGSRVATAATSRKVLILCKGIRETLSLCKYLIIRKEQDLPPPHL